MNRQDRMIAVVGFGIPALFAAAFGVLLFVDFDPPARKGAWKTVQGRTFWEDAVPYPTPYHQPHD